MSQELKRRFGWFIVFRGCEIGTYRREDRTWNVHLHTVWNGPFVRKEKWKKLLEFVHKVWGYVCEDSGIVKSPTECAKYPFKPAEVARLPDCELLTLADQLKGRRMVSCLASLKDQRRQVREAKGRYRARRGKVSIVHSCNFVQAAKRLTPEAKKRRLERRQARDNWNRYLDGKPFRDLPAPAKPSGWRLLARMAPAAWPTPLLEPQALIWASDDIEAERGAEAVRTLPVERCIIAAYDQAAAECLDVPGFAAAAVRLDTVQLIAPWLEGLDPTAGPPE
jgi:hypothetical protein